MSTVSNSLVPHTASQTLRSAGSLAVYAIKTPCVREGLMMAGSAHAARHFGSFPGLATLAGESAILFATGYGSIPSIALGVGFYYLPQGIEFFAQKAISKVGFAALNTLGQVGWHMAYKGAGLTALGVSRACKGIYTLCRSNRSSQQAAPAIVNPMQNPQAQFIDILAEVSKLKNEVLELKKVAALATAEETNALIVRLDALTVKCDVLKVKLEGVMASYSCYVKKTSSREGVSTTARQATIPQPTTAPTALRKSSRVRRVVCYK